MAEVLRHCDCISFVLNGIATSSHRTITTFTTRYILRWWAAQSLFRRVLIYCPAGDVIRRQQRSRWTPHSLFNIAAALTHSMRSIQASLYTYDVTRTLIHHLINLITEMFYDVFNASSIHFFTPFFPSNTHHKQPQHSSKRVLWGKWNVNRFYLTGNKKFYWFFFPLTSFFTPLFWLPFSFFPIFFSHNKS